MMSENRIIFLSISYAIVVQNSVNSLTFITENTANSLIDESANLLTPMLPTNVLKSGDLDRRASLTLENCICLCWEEQQCQSINYHRQLTLCELNTAASPDAERLGFGTRPGDIYRVKSTWKEEQIRLMCSRCRLISEGDCSKDSKSSYCPEPGVVAETEVLLGNLRRKGSKIRYACIVSNPSGPPTILPVGTSQCQENRSWSPARRPCMEPEQCPALTSPLRGAVDVSGPQLLGTMATYTCDYGTALGDTVRYCLLSGVWSGTVPSCPTDCSSVPNASGEYTVYPCNNCAPIQVCCDITSDSGGWTVFQRRLDGSEDFFRNWADYKAGFGNPNGEFWMGLDHLHSITSCGSYELMVVLEDFEGNTRCARYSSFYVDDEASNYVLHVSEYSGTAGDAMSYHNGQPFTTRDVDNDGWHGNCAVSYKGAWWYNGCHRANLNSLYLGGPTSLYAVGVRWLNYNSLKTSIMMLRRTTNQNH